jgi:hypothetical protein
MGFIQYYVSNPKNYVVVMFKKVYFYSTWAYLGATKGLPKVYIHRPTCMLVGIPRCYNRHFIVIYETFVVAPCAYMTIGLPQDHILSK